MKVWLFYAIAFGYGAGFSVGMGLGLYYEEYKGVVEPSSYWMSSSYFVGRDSLERK